MLKEYSKGRTSAEHDKGPGRCRSLCRALTSALRDRQIYECGWKSEDNSLVGDGGNEPR